jgi:hypothetical protein
MEKIWINKARSFREAQDFDDNYYLAMSETQRLETVQFLREIYSRLKGNLKYARRGRLRRFIKIIQ